MDTSCYNRMLEDPDIQQALLGGLRMELIPAVGPEHPNYDTAVQMQRFIESVLADLPPLAAIPWPTHHGAWTPTTRREARRAHARKVKRGR